MQLSANKHRRSDSLLSRRLFLKLAAGVTGGLLSPVSALAVLDSKSYPFKNLAFFNIHTHEKLHVCYSRNGKCDPAALKKINYILRDHRVGEIKSIDTKLLDLLHAISIKLKVQQPFYVISGYRSPATNRKLRKLGSGVASKSLHMQGKAIDIRVPRYSTRRLRNVAVLMKGGGVGYYPKSDFVHIDIGRVRYW